MKSPAKRKAYEQIERAALTEQTRRDILVSAIALIQSSRRVSEVTLQQIAEGANVALRTVLRHYGSREGVFEAAFQQIQIDISANRVETPPHDLDSAMESLCASYESDGDLMIKALEEEHDIPLLHDLLEEGRRYHRAWLEKHIGPMLPSLPKAEREARYRELYAASDVYLWKLLRKDLNTSRKEAQRVLLNLVSAVILQAQSPR